MLRLIISALFLTAAKSFVVNNSPHHAPNSVSSLQSKKDGGDDVVQQQAFASGSFIEFVEKKRNHIGKIESVEHKSSGGARYQWVSYLLTSCVLF